MIKLDNDLLQELGLAALPEEEKRKLLAHIYETLEMRVGMKLAEQMSEAQLTEFEQFIDRNDESSALKWLETNFPHYKDVVAAEFERLKGEIRQVAPQIVASSNNPGSNNPGQSPAQTQAQGQPYSDPQWQQPQQQHQAPPPQAGQHQQHSPAQPQGWPQQPNSGQQQGGHQTYGAPPAHQPPASPWQQSGHQQDHGDSGMPPPPPPPPPSFR